MKMLTRTMLGTLLLAGGASLALAAGANPDATLPNATTPDGMSSTSTAPTMVPGGAMWNDQSADNPARPPSIAQGDQTQGGDQTGARRLQDQPTRTDQMRSPDLAQVNTSAHPSAVPQDSAPSATAGWRASRQHATHAAANPAQCED